MSPSIPEKQKKEIANASRDDIVEALKAIFHGESKDHFRVIKITEEGGLKPDVFSFNHMLSNERIDQVLKTSEICDYKELCCINKKQEKKWKKSSEKSIR